MAIPLSFDAMDISTWRTFEIELGLCSPKTGMFRLPKLKEADREAACLAIEQLLVCYLSSDRATLQKLRPMFKAIFILGICVAGNEKASLMRDVLKNERNANTDPEMKIINDVVTKPRVKHASQTALLNQVNLKLEKAGLKKISKSTFQRRLKSIAAVPVPQSGSVSV